MNSILNSVKKLLGITEDTEDFDVDILIHINSTFMILNQLGVGPKEGFSITGPETEWSEFIEQPNLIEAVKSYMYMQVRLMFDPPQTSSVLESMKEKIKELEWRLNVQVDPENQNEVQT